MPIYIALLAKTEPIWDTLKVVGEQTLKRNIFAQLDAKRITDRDLATYIMTLGEVLDEGENPINHLIYPAHILRNIHISMLLISEEIISADVARYTDLQVTSVETVKRGITLSIVSGTLEQWRISIINCLADKEDDILKEFFTKSLLLFEGLKLGKLWERYTKTSTNTGILLIEKD